MSDRIRPSLSIPWDDFISHWCLGSVPAFGEAELAESLTALERHYPEQLDALESSGTRGLAPVINMIRFGSILARTQGLSGFIDVLDRMKSGEVSAMSELECVDALVRAGVVPAFGVPLRGKLLDAAFQLTGRAHYVEVVAPNRSDAMVEVQSLLAKLGTSLSPLMRGMNLEVLLEPSFSDENVADIVSALAVADTNPEIRELETLCRYRKVKATAALISPSIPRTGTSPILAFGAGGFDGEEYTVVAVRFPIDDLRAERTFAAELHHFSRDEPNILFMDLTRVIGGIGAWMPMIERRFQPTRNTRVGAVVLFERGSVAGQNKVWERWKVLPNPHARVPIPETLIVALRALDCGPITAGGQ